MKTCKTLHVCYTRPDDHTRQTKLNACEGIPSFFQQSAKIFGPPLKECQHLPAPYKQLIHDLKQNQQTPTNQYNV